MEARVDEDEGRMWRLLVSSGRNQQYGCTARDVIQPRSQLFSFHLFLKQEAGSPVV
jgi:hypothetical protein